MKNSFNIKYPEKGKRYDVGLKRRSDRKPAMVFRLAL